MLPGTSGIKPTPYRFASLLERAKQLVAHGQQLEAALLAALEKRDAEAYTLLKARQDVGLARAGVLLERLKGVEADAGVRLTEIQKTRAQDTADHWNELLNNDTIEGLEIASMAAMAAAIVLDVVAVATEKDPAGKASHGAAAASTASSLLSAIASYELQRDEWQFNETVAQDDVAIADQQIKIASNHVLVAGREQKNRAAARRSGRRHCRLPGQQVHQCRTLRVDERRSRADLPVLPPAGGVDGPARRGTARVRAPGGAARGHPGGLLGAPGRQRGRPAGGQG